MNGAWSGDAFVPGAAQHPLVMRRRPGTIRGTAVGKVPDQQRTAPLRSAPHPGDMGKHQGE